MPAEEVAESEASEWELRERREREEAREAEAEKLGAAGEVGCWGGAAAVPAYTLLYGIRRRWGVGDEFSFHSPCLSLSLPFPSSKTFLSVSASFVRIFLGCI